MIQFWLCIVFSVVIYLNIAWSQNFEGDYCLIKRTGDTGICQLLENCTSAIKDLQNRVGYPQTCGFKSNKPIVCCSKGDGHGGSITTDTPPTRTTTKSYAASTTTTKTTTRQSQSSSKPNAVTSTTVPKATQYQKVGEKANQKCKDYAQYAYVEVENPLTATRIFREECQGVEPLIVGGDHAKPKEFPHMALIGFQSDNNKKMWLCGGSLVSESFVITAAHCLNNRPYGEPKYIRLGDLDTRTDSDDAQAQELNVLKLFKHPEYIPPSQYNDIGLIQMNKKATFNAYVKPICINTGPPTTKDAIASDWGRIDYASTDRNSLLKVTLQYFSNDECNYFYKKFSGRRMKNGIDSKTQVCAGSRTYSMFTCQGDSGGPLQVKNYNQVPCTYKLIGVTSIPKVCGTEENIPRVYTLISAYIEWIENIVWP